MGCTASGSTPSVAVPSVAAPSFIDSSGFWGDMVDLSRAVGLGNPSMWSVKEKGVRQCDTDRVFPVLAFGGKDDIVLYNAVLREPICRPSTGCCLEEWFVTFDLDVAHLHNQILGCTSVTHKESELRIAIHEGRSKWALPDVKNIREFVRGRVVPKMCGRLFVYAGRLIFLVYHAEF